MEIITWISGITAAAKLVEAWNKARKSGDEFKKVLEETNSKQESSVAEEKIDLVISDDLLQAFVKDINSASKRFSDCINDPRYTPAQIDQEQDIAKKSICTHLGKITELNQGILPNAELIRISKSFQCGV